MNKLILKILLTFFLSANHFVYPQDFLGDTNEGIQDEPKVFTIDSSRSFLRVFVGRAGLLSEMGHNHIITSKNITGNLNYLSPPLISTAIFSIPAQALIIDDDSERKNAGDEYNSVPSISDKQGTKNNMLSNSVLDANNYPMIQLNIEGISINNKLNTYNVQISIKNQTIFQALPALVSFNDNTMTIDANFVLNHSQLKLKPFSILGGMLRVADQLRFELHLEALNNL
jgi:hypothetical protein